MKKTCFFISELRYLPHKPMKLLYNTVSMPFGRGEVEVHELLRQGHEGTCDPLWSAWD